MFKLDPVALLDDRDEFHTAVRLAAALHIMAEKQREYEEASRK